MNINEFAKLGLIVGKIVSIESVPDSKKLLRFNVDIGENSPRQILSGVAGIYDQNLIIGKNVIVAANISPKIMAGKESSGMLIGIEGDQSSSPSLIFLEQDLKPGTIIS